MATKKSKFWQRVDWQKTALALAVIVTATLFYTWHLGSTTPGLSSNELSAIGQSHSVSAIYNNPVYAPHKLLQLGFSKLRPNSLAFLKLSSVIFALIFIASLYFIIRKWFGKTVAVLAAAMAAVTPWYAILGRSASPDIMLAIPVLIGSLVLAIQKDKSRQELIFWALIISVAIGLYVPGVLWLLVLALVLRFGGFRQRLEGIRNYKLIGGTILLLVLISPLIKASIGNWQVASGILALPQHSPHVLQFAKSLGWSALALVWRAPYHSPWYLGRLPALDVIQTALVVFGVYAMFSLAKPKAELLLACLGLGLVLEALNSNLSMSLLTLPVLFILLAAGLRYLYFEWHGIFPYNPIPKFIALVLISLLAGTHLVYGVRYTLIAWPHNDQTVQAYRDTIKG